MIEKTYASCAKRFVSVYEMKTGHFQLKSASGNKLMLLFFFDNMPRFIRRNTPYTEEPFHYELPEGITKSFPLPPQSQVAKPRMPKRHASGVSHLLSILMTRQKSQESSVQKSNSFQDAVGPQRTLLKMKPPRPHQDARKRSTAAVRSNKLH